MTSNDTGLLQRGFEIAFLGRSVDVILHPATAGTERPAADAILLALQGTPLRHFDRQRIENALATSVGATDAIRFSAGEAVVPPQAKGPCVIVIAANALAAYAVPAMLPQPAEERDEGGDDARPMAAPAPSAQPPDDARPPDNTPAEAAEAAEAAASALLSAARLRESLASAGVVAGVLEDVVDAFADGQPLDTIVCVARGEPAVPARNATLEYHFDLHPRLLPKPRADGSMDYHSVLVERSVEEGTALVTRKPPVEGRAGQDVRGRVLGVAPAKDVDLERLVGRNTALRDDEVIAAVPGRPVLAGNGRIEVLPVFDVPGDLDYAVGNIDFPGDVVIRGDVKAGFSITAGGSVVVGGLVEGATIKTEHDLSVAGSAGEHGNVFEVGGNLVAQYLHATEARVAGIVSVAREIVNCRLTAERIRTGPTGRIVGGATTATTEIDTGSLGSPKGSPTELCVTSRDSAACIRARRSVYPGVKIQLGVAHLKIQDEREGASFWEVARTVLSLRSSAEEADANRAREAPLVQ